ncbi:hypothetical protein HDU84_000304 [Entophlyctis sp. JEL0112]|nr:hypothetical protein HDU84_000304 [Entophlyctis sp. JEL0112]
MATGSSTRKAAWESSSTDISYRLSSRIASAIDRRIPRDKDDQNDTDNWLKETHVSFTPESNVPKAMGAINCTKSVPATAFTISLWSLSLVSCTKLTEHALMPLANLAALGFLDVSKSDISIRAILALRPVHIMRLHLFHCPKIQSLAKEEKDNQSKVEPALQISGITAQHRACEESMEEVLGFLIYGLPNVWSINGPPILSIERKKWSSNFSHGGKGQYSKLHTLACGVERRFVAREKKMNPPTSTVKGEYIYHSPASKKLWSNQAKNLIANMPSEFNMAAEKDSYTLPRLVSDLETRVIGCFPQTVFSFEKVQGSVAQVIGTQVRDVDQHTTRSECLRNQITLALLLFATFVEEIPILLLQGALESIFVPDHESRGRTPHWAQVPVSPLFWSIQERLEYLGMITAVVERDLSLAHSTLLTKLQRRVSLFRPSLQYLYETAYSQIRDDQEIGSNAEIHDAGFGDSREKHVFHARLKVLEAVDGLLTLCQDHESRPGSPNRFTEATMPSQTTSETETRKENEQQKEPVMGALDLANSDDEMYVYEHLRKMRIARHPRDPVPSSLVLVGKQPAIVRKPNE